MRFVISKVPRNEDLFCNTASSATLRFTLSKDVGLNPELLRLWHWQSEAITKLKINLELCIPEKELAKTCSQISLHISKVIHDILPGTTRSQKELGKPYLNLCSQGCHHEKILNLTPWIRTRDPCISSK